MTPKLKKKWKNDPVWWAKTILKENLWDIQRKIIESIRDNKRTAVKTCHGIGKTRVAADAALWFLYAHKNAVVLTTAPTWRQVEQLLWREIRARYNSATLKLPGRLFQTPRLEVNNQWYALGISTKEPERFQGFHAEWILIIVDESSGVNNAIFEAIRGVMSSGNVRLLLLGNPTKPEGEFYDAFNSKRHMYQTISVSAWETPNLAPIKADYDRCKNKTEKLALLRNAPLTRSYLVNPSWVADMLDEFSEDSSIFKVRVLGEFPPDSPDQLIPLHKIEEAQNRWYEAMKWWEMNDTERAIKKTGQVKMGVDIARYGECETVFVARAGDIMAPLVAMSKQDTMVTAGKTIIYAREQRASWINMDVVGVGAGVYDRCNELQLTGINPINGGDTAKNPEKFVNKRAEAYWELRQRFEKGEIAIPTDNKLAGQLSGLKYKATSKGQVQIESKEDMIKRGVSSPDRADALCLAFYEDNSTRVGFQAVGKREELVW